MKIYELLETAEKGNAVKYDPISKKQLKQYLETSYSNVVALAKRNWLIYRGSNALSSLFHSGKSKFFSANSTLTTRSSTNAANYYTLFLDNNPLMSGYPKRSKSFICTLDLETAHNYSAKPAIVIPKNNAAIASTQSTDMWDVRVNFLGISRSIEYMSSIIFLRWLECKESIESMFEKINDAENHPDLYVDSACKYFNIPSHLSRNDVLRTISELKSTLEKAYSSKELGFKLTDTSALDAAPRSEVWFSGECLFLEYSQEAVDFIANI